MIYSLMDKRTQDKFDEIKKSIIVKKKQDLAG